VFTKRVRPERGWLLVLSAMAVFCLLAAMPIILPRLHLQLHPTAATSSHGVKLLPAPAAPRPVSLPPVAQPIDPGQPPAPMTTASATAEAAAVSAEDARIRTMLHDANHIFEPEVIPTRGALPTLVLTGGQGEYTSADLIRYGAMVTLPHHAALLLDNVFVAANARLSLGSSALRTLYLDNGSGGFASIVAWGGNLAFHGPAGMPLTIIGWDRTLNQPAADSGSGRSYIREVGGKMTLSNVRVSSLGFWSGRTGGIAWTGLIGDPSTGGATNSTFTDCSYGAFVSRGLDVGFSDDLFEFNELDGLHIHRYSVNTSVVDSSASRNGGSGFVVSPATQDTELTSDVSQHNSGDGFFIDGRPLATGASASGGTVTPGSGTTVRDSAVLDNGKIGILVEGGTGTVIEGDQVCGQVTAVAVRYGVTGGVLTGNDIRCSPRSGLSIGPDTPGLVISGNTIVGPRTGILVSSAGPVQMDNNKIIGATVFGISARGAASRVTGVANVISGNGFRAIDSRADAPMPDMSSSNVSGWASHSRVTFLSYLQFHPLAVLWLSIATLVLLGWAWSHRRKLPSHPYPVTTRWRAEMPDAPASAESPLASVSTLRPVPAFTADARDAEVTEPLPVVDAVPWSARAPRHPQAPAGSVPTIIRSTQWWERTREPATGGWGTYRDPFPPPLSEEADEP
jgi:hypothetical protein